MGASASHTIALQRGRTICAQPPAVQGLQASLGGKLSVQQDMRMLKLQLSSCRLCQAQFHRLRFVSTTRSARGRNGVHPWLEHLGQQRFAGSMECAGTVFS